MLIAKGYLLLVQHHHIPITIQTVLLLPKHLDAAILFHANADADVQPHE